MITLQHRVKARRREAIWEFDPSRKVIDIILTGGKAFDVRVCSLLRPIFHAFVLATTGRSWKVTSFRFEGGFAEEDDGSLARVLIPQPAAIVRGLSIDDEILLIDAPAQIRAELVAL